MKFVIILSLCKLQHRHWSETRIQFIESVVMTIDIRHSAPFFDNWGTQKHCSTSSNQVVGISCLATRWPFIIQKFIPLYKKSWMHTV